MRSTTWIKFAAFVMMLTLMVGVNALMYMMLSFLNMTVPHQSSSGLYSSQESARKLEKLGIQGFKIWNRDAVPFPCVPDHENTYNGIYYIKIPRTSSKPTTVLKRLAIREAAQLPPPPHRRISSPMEDEREQLKCKINDMDRPLSAYDQKVFQREKAKSFLMSMVRHPAHRAMSHFDLRLRLNEVKPTTEAFINDVRTSMSYYPNVELRFLSPQEKLRDVPESQYEDLIKKILEEYNFIGVHERMNESLVAFSMILGIEMKDVIYEFSRCDSHGKHDWLTPPMEQYLKSQEWIDKQKGDYLLYEAVNVALDHTIAKLGQVEFMQRLKDYEILLDVWSKVSMDISGKEGCGAFFSGLTDARVNAWLKKFL